MKRQPISTKLKPANQVLGRLGEQEKRIHLRKHDLNQGVVVGIITVITIMSPKP